MLKAIQTSRKPIKGLDRKSRKPLQLLHSDVCGPIKPPYKGGKQHFGTLYDNRSAVSSVRFMNAREVTMEKLKKKIAELEAARKTNWMKGVGMGNDEEFIAEALTEYF